MKTLTKKQINEIAEMLDCGFRCFYNKQNGELIFIPDTSKHFDMDTEAWADEMGKLDNNYHDYFEIDGLESRDSFEIMTDFVDSLSDSDKIKNRLIAALNKRKPFREFKFVIDDSGEYRQIWFDFKSKKIQEWVKERFNEMINLEKYKASG